MSAECPDCMWDLSYGGECVRCRLEEERDAALTALAIRVRPETATWNTGGQTVTWIWNEEHEAAIELLRRLGHEPIGGLNPSERSRLNPADTRDCD